MADTKIRITSNPYTRLLRFDRWDEGWQAIDSSNAPTSGLIKADVLNGFLPFKAKQIVDLIFKEYGGNTTIVFEGPGDEYEDLRSVCSEPDYQRKLKLTYGENDLQNASAVLPRIVEVFREVEALIDGVVDDKAAVESDISKFVDVSKDQVPLCVIGNYSAGKSTFINALIGYEVLPSGTEPVTAKVFKVKPITGTAATISFGEGDSRQELTYGPDGILFEESTGNEAFLTALSDYLKEHCRERSLAAQMNYSIQFINGLSRTCDDMGVVIPDLVEIDVPFNPTDPWMGGHNFVIFDTPGSNSATNLDHVRVLKDKMEGLSDGLIIYLAKADTLNTKDNDELCDFVRSIDAMDDRFTMVVVNFADQGSFPLTGFDPTDEQRKLDQAVCRRLEPQGIFYVSALMGLGAKTGGVFSSKGTTDYYNRIISKFIDRGASDYTELYRCNIMPEHKKKQSIRDSAACDNRLLANCGLYCIESEIELFARRYSAYNKCHQAEMLLRRVIDAATDTLSADKKQLENDRAAEEEKLNHDKDAINQSLGSCRREWEAWVPKDYKSQIIDKLSFEHWLITMDKLKSMESGFTQESGEEHDLETAKASDRDARKAVREHFVSQIRDAARSKNVDSLRDAFIVAAEDVDKFRESRTKLISTQREVDRQAANQLLASVRDSFTRSFDVMTSDIEVRSKRFWKERSEEVRESLYDTATGSTALSEEKRREIGDVIIRFQPLSLTTDAEAIFVKSELEETLRLLNVVIFESGRLDLRKVRKTYNARMAMAFKMAINEVDSEHTKSFFAWLDNLMAEINSNIESYNPVLEEHVESIKELSERIGEREEKLSELREHLDTVTRLISWRERG